LPEGTQTTYRVRLAHPPSYGPQASHPEPITRAISALFPTRWIHSR